MPSPLPFYALGYSQREREYDRPLSLWERVRVRVVNRCLYAVIGYHLIYPDKENTHCRQACHEGIKAFQECRIA